MKIQNITRALSCLLVLITLSSCNEFLGIKPKGFLIPQTAADYEALLNDAQLVKSSDTYPIFMTDDAYIPDVDMTGVFPGINSSERSRVNLYTFQKEIFGDSEDDALWVYSYNRIYTYNVIINDILEATEATEAEKKSIQAEAYLGRAFEYLNLVNAYAVHYDEATAQSDLGVPLVLTSDINLEHLTRATVAKVYQQIESDLLAAIPHLPNRPKINAFRGSKAAALGILARMYLYQGKYEDALKYAKQSIQANGTLLDMTQYKVVHPNRAIGRTNLPTLSNNPENIYIRLAPYVFGVSMAVYASPDLSSLFSEDDMRFELFYTSKPLEIPLDQPLWMPFIEANLAITTAEVYLTAAECEARVGSIDEAVSLINKLRTYRVKNPTPVVATSKGEVLQIVLDERRRELAFVGLSRLIDLKRLNKESQWAKTITREVEGQSYTLEPNSPNYVLPIPPKVLRFNPDMPPNARK